MSKQDADILRKAKELISTPEKWTQEGAYAIYDKLPDSVPESAVRRTGEPAEDGRYLVAYKDKYILAENNFPVLKEATCFCALGALAAASGVAVNDPIVGSVENLLQEAIANFGLPNGVISWNDYDCTTHADVMRVFDKAIELAEAAP